jgi:hypothetical protein
MEVKDQALEVAELAAKALVDASYDRLLEMIFDELKKVIPGSVDDMVIDTLKPIVAPKMKELLLAEIAKIDGK